MPRADRLFALVQLLTGARRRALGEIAAELRTSERTVYRDLSDLEDRGVPIERVDGRYRILDGAVMHSLPLSERERLLLGLALESPSVARQPAFRRAVGQLRARLAGSLKESGGARTLAAGPDRSGEIAEAVIDALERAIADCHSVSMLYTSLSEARPKPRWRGVDPWVLMHRSEAWYLIGRCHENEEPRTFRLDRVDAVLPIGTSFPRPEFDARSWFESAWGVIRTGESLDVTILFEPSVAPLIEHGQHHPSEVKLRLPDGRLEYRVRVAALDEIARWVVGFGGNAVAVEPEEFVDRVRAIAAGAGARTS